jgi:hypothetical protein
MLSPCGRRSGVDVDVEDSKGGEGPLSEVKDGDVVMDTGDRGRCLRSSTASTVSLLRRTLLLCGPAIDAITEDDRGQLSPLGMLWFTRIAPQCVSFTLRVRQFRREHASDALDDVVSVRSQLSLCACLQHVHAPSHRMCSLPWPLSSLRT